MPSPAVFIEESSSRLRAAHQAAVALLASAETAGVPIMLGFAHELQLDDGVVPEWIQLMPLTPFSHPRFGVTDPSEQLIDLIIANLERDENDLVVDYNHQSVRDGDAPAAGFCDRFERRADGLWGHLAGWTRKAIERLKSREYRWISPTIMWVAFDRATDAWIGPSLHSIALTNTPQIDGMADITAPHGRPLFAFSRAELPAPAREDAPMNYTALLALLGLVEGATDEEAVAAYNANIEAANAEGRKLAGGEQLVELNAKLAGLEAQLASRPSVAEKAKLEAELLEANAKVACLTDGVPPALHKSAMQLYAQGPDAYKEFTQNIVLVPNSITSPSSRPGTGALTSDQLDLCNQLGIKPAEFAAQQAARRAS